MKLCIIGNSHVGAIQMAWQDGLSKTFDFLDLTFFAQRGSDISNLIVAHDRLLPKNEQMRKSIKFTSGGKLEIVVADYDGFLIYGLHKHIWNSGDTYYSSAALKRARLDHVRLQGNFILLEKLRCLSDKPIWFAHNPWPVLRSKKTAQSGYPSLVAEIEDILYQPLRTQMVVQPHETLAGAEATKEKYSVGSERLSVGRANDRSKHLENDTLHMNTDYGKIWLRAFCSEYLQKTAQRR